MVLIRSATESGAGPEAPPRDAGLPGPVLAHDVLVERVVHDEGRRSGAAPFSRRT